MASALVQRESPMEYFRALVESAVEHQRVRPSEQTTFYLVNLLTGFVRTDDALGLDGPLAIRLARALQAGGTEQREALRRVGDASLFISGFFSESLSRQLVDVDYYIALGGYAYGSLGRRDEDSRAATFAELAERFADFVDLLGEISEKTTIGSGPTDLLRLYEKWLRTGSRRNGERLASRGIVPNASIGSRFLQ